jgi:transglutaminase-like putative cysteine protease
MSCALVACALLAASVAPATAGAPARKYDIGWTIQVDQVPAGARQAVVWVAIPQDLPEQQVTDFAVTSDYTWKIVEDPTFHNRVAQVTVPDPPPAFTIDLRAKVTREPVEEPRKAKLSAKERSLYLRKEALVSLSPRIHAIADSIENSNRARYDYVLTTMDYDKTAPGWGHGDSERACDVRKGNCTDFHSLFMSLSRAEGVPVVFEMGYPTVPEGETNKVGGYHCWAWFYDEKAGAWVPVDISEADKHAEKAEYFYGNLDADRITFSRGRDVALPGMKNSPLNYMPCGAYVEVDGKPLTESVSRAISYTVDAGAKSKAKAN